MLYTYEHEIFFHGDDEPFYYTSDHSTLLEIDTMYLKDIGFDPSKIREINTEKL